MPSSLYFPNRLYDLYVSVYIFYKFKTTTDMKEKVEEEELEQQRPSQLFPACL